MAVNQFTLYLVRILRLLISGSHIRISLCKEGSQLKGKYEIPYLVIA